MAAPNFLRVAEDSREMLIQIMNSRPYEMSHQRAVDEARAEEANRPRHLNFNGQPKRQPRARYFSASEADSYPYGPQPTITDDYGHIPGDDSRMGSMNVLHHVVPDHELPARARARTRSEVLIPLALLRKPTPRPQEPFAEISATTKELAQKYRQDCLKYRIDPRLTQEPQLNPEQSALLNQTLASIVVSPPSGRRVHHNSLSQEGDAPLHEVMYDLSPVVEEEEELIEKSRQPSPEPVQAVRKPIWRRFGHWLDKLFK